MSAEFLTTADKARIINDYQRENPGARERMQEGSFGCTLWQMFGGLEVRRDSSPEVRRPDARPMGGASGVCGVMYRMCSEGRYRTTPAIEAARRWYIDDRAPNLVVHGDVNGKSVTAASLIVGAGAVIPHHHRGHLVSESSLARALSSRDSRFGAEDRALVERSKANVLILDHCGVPLPRRDDRASLMEWVRSEIWEKGMRTVMTMAGSRERVVGVYGPMVSGFERRTEFVEVAL